MTIQDTYLHKGYLRFIIRVTMFSLLSIQVNGKNAKHFGLNNPDPINLNAGYDNLSIDREVFIFKKAGLKDISDPINNFLAKHNDQFKKAGKKVTNYGFDKTWLYIFFKLNNNSKITLGPIVEIANPILDEVYLYQLSDTGPRLIASGGDQFPFEQRSIKHNHFRAALTLMPHDTIGIFIKIKNNGEQFFVPLSVKSPEYIRQNDREQNYYHGLYFGILLFVFIFNLFIGLIIKVRSSIYYILYILCLAFLQLSLNGLSFEYFWPENTWMAAHSNAIFASLAIFFLILFTIEFLNIKENLKRFHVIFNAFLLLVGLNIILTLINSDKVLYISILGINGLTLVLNILIIPTTFVIFKKGYKPARYFLLSFIILILCVFIFVLKNAGVVATNWVTVHSLEIGSIVEVILLSFAIVDKFKTFRDDAYSNLLELNKVKSEANILLEEKVNERTRELKKQKEIVEIKNRDITDSIIYAQRIQEAILPPDKEMKASFKGLFVVYLPKDIVSGDFYWHSVKNEKIFIAAVDCTGHGVPGAFMSMLGYDILNQVVNIDGETDTGKILSELNNRIFNSLNRKSNRTGVHDGMDMALCMVDKKNKSLHFSGAHRPLWMVRENELTEYKGERFGIGGYLEGEKSFGHNTIPYKTGDRFYICSDGFADQFGDKINKKFSPRQLKDEILSTTNLNMDEQGMYLENALKAWLGEKQLIDDVLLIGFGL